MISLEHCTKQMAHPFPVAVFDNVLTIKDFDMLVDTFPDDLSGARRHGEGRGRYNKDCLSNRHHSDEFVAALATRPLWARLYNEIMFMFPGYCDKALSFSGFNLKHFSKVSTTMEFSSLPGDGGGLQPHPDSAKKVATAVFYMEKEWNDDWGGAFEVLRHQVEGTETDLAPWTDVDTVETVHVRPARAVFMRRTPISYHGVRPLKAPRPRRSITVNLIAR